MTKKLLMIILCVVFIVGIGLLAFVSTIKKNPASIVVPLPKPTIAFEITATPTPEDPFVTLGKSIKEDIRNINDDLSKIKKEDNRLVPPTFLFDF